MGEGRRIAEGGKDGKGRWEEGEEGRNTWKRLVVVLNSLKTRHEVEQLWRT